MDEHNKFMNQKLVEEIFKDALEEMRVKAEIKYPIQATYEGTLEEVMFQVTMHTIIYGTIEYKLEVIDRIVA